MVEAQHVAKVFSTRPEMSPEVLDLFPDNHLTIPMSSLIRSFNIANSVAFVVGEAKRQIGLQILD